MAIGMVIKIIPVIIYSSKFLIMKQLFFFLTILTISLSTIAQGNSHKKAKGNNKHGHTGVNAKSYSKHQPKKVQAALLRDYPGASNITWSKYKGDYTATFNNGPWRSTAVYHANGERRDTRTVLTRAQLPGTIWDRIFKRDRITPTEYIEIDRPSSIEKIFRIRSANNTAYFYDQYGNKVTYNY